jgi:hypothetical protein
MFRRILFLFINCFFFFACGNAPPINNNAKPKKENTGQITDYPKKGILTGIELKRGQEKINPTFTARSGDTIFFCSSKGRIEIADTVSRDRKLFIDLHVGIMVDKIYVLCLPERRWLWVWQETYEEGIESDFALFTSGNPDPVWKLKFKDPNPGMPVADGNAVYISTLGRVAKISLTDGHPVWVKEGLYNSYKFSFMKIDKPVVFPDKVIFVDFPIPGHRDSRDSLFLDPLTGERKK